MSLNERLAVAKARLDEATNWHQYGEGHDEDGWCCKRETELRDEVHAIEMGLPEPVPQLSLESATTIAEEIIKKYQGLEADGYTHWHKRDMGRMVQVGVNAALAAPAPQPQGVTLHENCYTCETIVKPHCLAQPAPAVTPEDTWPIYQTDVGKALLGPAAPAEDVERACAFRDKLELVRTQHNWPKRYEIEAITTEFAAISSEFLAKGRAEGLEEALRRIVKISTGEIETKTDLEAVTRMGAIADDALAATQPEQKGAVK